MKLKTLIFTILGDYNLSKKNGAIRARSLVKLVGPFGFTNSAVRTTLHRLKREGLITSVNRGSYTFSQETLLKFETAIRRVKEWRFGHWDGKWRVVVYNFSEDNKALRNKIRRELKWLGFGALASSTWVSPNPLEDVVNEMIEKYWKDGGKVYLFIAYFPQDPQIIIRTCWNLSEIELKYKEFISKWIGLLNKIDKLSPAEAFVNKITILHEYRKFLHIDPGLPEELLPSDWIGYEAYKLFKNIYDSLTPLANKYFESVYEE
jgi:phenylacetic acid degradation operon negative regulatory protein